MTSAVAQSAEKRFDRPTIEDYLFHEAELLDSGRWSEWFNLFTDDAYYWVPAHPGQKDPYNEVSLIYDDIATLQVRVNRMNHPAHHANQPAVLGAHHISNVRLLSAINGECRVASRLLMVDRRGDALRIFSARVEHSLRLFEGRIRIAWKKVELLGAEGPHEELVIPF